MKIRNGFVSNSSSSSFLILAKQMPDVPAPVEDKEYVEVEVIDEDYSRGRNELITSLEDKIRLITTLYATTYYDWTNFNEDLYVEKMIAFKNKIENLGNKYNYSIDLTIPPIFISTDVDFDYNGNPIHTNKITKDVRVSTEWHDGAELIKTIVEDKDTSRLERLLFNSDSKLIVGGDEYEENAVICWNVKQSLIEHPFDYDFFGTEDEEYFGTYEPDYVNGKVPSTDDGQPTLPFEKDENCCYRHCDDGLCKNWECRYCAIC